MRKNQGFVLAKLLPFILILGVLILTAFLLGQRTGFFYRAAPLTGPISGIVPSPTPTPTASYCKYIDISPKGNFVAGQNYRLESIGTPQGQTVKWSVTSNGSDLGNFSSKYNNPVIWTSPSNPLPHQVWYFKALPNGSNVSCEGKISTDQPSPTPVPTNQLQNPSFEIDSNNNSIPDHWKGKKLDGKDKLVTGTVFDGLKSFRFSPSLSGHQEILSQTLAVSGKQNSAITFSFVDKTGSIPKGPYGGSLKITYNDNSTSTTALALPKASYDWTKQTIISVASKPFKTITVALFNSNSASNLWVDATHLTINPNSSGIAPTISNVSSSFLDSLSNNL